MYDKKKKDEEEKKGLEGVERFAESEIFKRLKQPDAEEKKNEYFKRIKERLGK